MVRNGLHQKAFKLRLKGKSYGEIKCVLNIPKSTLSSWFKNLDLPLSIQKIIDLKRLAPRKQLMEFNRRRTQIIQTENIKIRQAAADGIKSLSKYELLLIGASLYWAEGYNRQDKIRSPCISFGNSNSDLVVLFLRFLREVMQIPEERFRPFVQIHHNIKPELAIKFWSKVIDIPKERFHITRQVSRASKGKRPKNSLPYGTLKLNVNGRQSFFQIKGWIDGLIKQTAWKPLVDFTKIKKGGIDINKFL